MNLKFYSLSYLKKLTAFLETIRKKDIVLLLFIIIGALGARLVNLGVQQYWGDEMLSISIVKHFRSIKDLISYLLFAEIHPPLPYLILHYWSGWFGYSEFALRIPSVIFGLLAVLVSYLFGRFILHSTRIGLLSALIVAFLPIQIHYSQSTRPYITYMLFGLLMLYGYCKYREKTKFIYILLYIITGTIGAYLHYSFILLVLVPMSLLWLFDIIVISRVNVGRQLMIYILTHAAIFLAFYPWLPAVFYKQVLGEYPIFGTLRSGSGLDARPLDLLGGTANQLIWLSKNKPVSRAEVFGVFIFKLTLVAFVIQLLLKKTNQIWQIVNNDSRVLFYLLWMYFVPLMVYLYLPLSVSYTPIYQQSFIMGSVILSILFAYILNLLDTKKLIILVMLFFISIFTFTVNIMGDDSTWDPSYREKFTTGFINDNYQEGDLVILGYDIHRVDFNFYLRPELSAVGFYPLNFYGLDYMSSRETLGIAENDFHFRIGSPTRAESFERFRSLIKFYKPKRIWIAYFNWEAWADEWFTANGWKKTFWSPTPLLPLGLYQQP